MSLTMINKNNYQMYRFQPLKLKLQLWQMIFRISTYKLKITKLLNNKYNNLLIKLKTIKDQHQTATLTLTPIVLMLMLV